MKTARFALSALASLSFVALAGMSGCACGGPSDSNESAEPSADETSSTEQNLDNTGDDSILDPPELTVTTLATGDGWRRIRFLGRLVNEDTGVTEQTDRTLLVIEGSSKIASAPVPSKIKQALVAEAALKSAAEASETLAVDEKLAQTYLPHSACSNDDTEYSKGVSDSKTKVFKKEAVSGAQSGSVTITTTLSASANASLSVLTAT